MPSTLNPQPSTSPHAYYHADGNGNVTCLINTNQLIVAKYLYDPYGNILSLSGPLAEANLYRFSSKEWHPNSGLVHYLYRYYDGSLQRWVNRDLVGEFGFENSFGQVTAKGASVLSLGVQSASQPNLYALVGNDPANKIDPLGLWQWGWPPWGKKKPKIPKNPYRCGANCQQWLRERDKSVEMCAACCHEQFVIDEALKPRQGIANMGRRDLCVQACFLTDGVAGPR